MNIRIFALLLLLVLISVSVTGCGNSGDKVEAAADQAEDSVSVEDEAEENSETEKDKNENEDIKDKSDVSDDDKEQKPEVTKTSSSKPVYKKKRTIEEIYDMLYGSWISDDKKTELIFSAGVGDISFRAALKTDEEYAFDDLVSYFDAAQTDDGIKIRFITGKGGLGSCKELVLANDEQTLQYRAERVETEDGGFYYNYVTCRKNTSDTKRTESKWKGKKGAFLGDSITQGINTSEGSVYWNFLADALQLSEAEPYGVAGSCVSPASDMKDSIPTFVTRYKDIRKDADLIVVFGGTNDYGFNTPLGSPEDTTDDTFYGALYVMLSGLKREHPNASIVYLTPLHRYGFGGLNNEREKNKAGYRLKNYIDAIKTQCQALEIPVIDTNVVSGMDAADESVRKTYLTDGLHPNEDGHKLLAERIADCFELLE